MSIYIDLSHTIQDGTPGFRMKNEDGSFTQFTVHVKPFITHAQSAPKYQGKAAFEISEISFQSAVGTYIDSPYHRYPEMGDIASLPLENLILPGIVIDARGRKPFEQVGKEVLPPTPELAGKAVLVHFGWDHHWGKEEYYSYPFLTRDCISSMIDAGVKMVGVDTLNIDDTHDPERPAHSWLLKRGIFVVENMTNLGAVLGKQFTFFAVPMKVKGAASMPVRAFGIANE